LAANSSVNSFISLSLSFSLLLSLSLDSLSLLVIHVIHTITVDLALLSLTLSLLKHPKPFSKALPQLLAFESCLSNHSLRLSLPVRLVPLPTRSLPSLSSPSSALIVDRLVLELPQTVTKVDRFKNNGDHSRSTVTLLLEFNLFTFLAS
jgi:hypothetical protein